MSETSETAPADRTALVDLAAQAIRDSNGTSEALAWWKAHPQMVPAHVYAVAVLSVLPATTDRTAEVEELRAELAKLIRWHREDGTALAEMRGTIERLRERHKAELADAAADVAWLRCLEAAGVDNWEGYDCAIEMRDETQQDEAVECSCGVLRTGPGSHLPECPNRSADETQQPETQARVHVGGNAEDCPACSGTNPDHPFICPGPDAAVVLPAKEA